MDHIDHPVSSQATSNLSRIFIQSDGSPIQIFAEAGGIQSRPKLMRKLKNHSASICNDPKNAHVILVNEESEQGKRFIRDWGGDSSKVVLHYTWVKKSIEAGRALGAHDDWGNCIAQDDGSMLDEADEDDMEIPNPLPTPRNTPLETSIIRSITPVSDTRIPATQSFLAQHDTIAVPSSPSVVGTMPTVPSGTLSSTPQPPSVPFSMMNGMGPFPQFPQMAMFNSVASQSMLPPGMTPQMYNIMAQQMMAMMMTSSGMSGITPESLSAAFSDVLAKHTSGSQPPIAQPRRSESPVPVQALPYPTIPPKSSELQPSRKASMATSTSSVRQRSPKEDSDSLNHAGPKGKKRVSSPSAKRRKLSVSSYHNDQGSPSAASSSSSKVNIPQKKIFQTDYGKDLAFFVQIDLHHRFKVVDAIKKNGGKIEKEQEHADYVVLYSGHKQQKAFKNLLTSTQMAGKIAIPAKYIYDCIDQGKLLDPSDYEFAAPPKGTRKWQSTGPVKTESEGEEEEREREVENTTQILAAEATRKRLAKNEREAERRRTMKLKHQEAEKEAHKQKTATNIEENKVKSSSFYDDSMQQPGRRTPTPPPEHTKMPWGNGYKFSIPEHQFALAYAELLVNRDHTASMSSICNAIHKKLPHHSLGSWKTQLPRILGSEIDAWRRRSSIAYRKSLRESQKLTTTTNPENMPSVSGTEIVSSPISTSPTTIPDSVGANSNNTVTDVDLTLITRFFIDADENESEEDLWKRLAATQPSRTLVQWQEFYSDNYDEIQKRHGELAKSFAVS